MLGPRKFLSRAEKIVFVTSTINPNVQKRPEKSFGFRAKSTIAQIYRELEQMRPQLFRLTSETEDNNDELMVILRLTDEVNRIINLCKDKHPDIINMQRWEKLVDKFDIPEISGLHGSMMILKIW